MTDLLKDYLKVKNEKWFKFIDSHFVSWIPRIWSVLGSSVWGTDSERLRTGVRLLDRSVGSEGGEHNSDGEEFGLWPRHSLGFPPQTQFSHPHHSLYQYHGVCCWPARPLLQVPRQRQVQKHWSNQQSTLFCTRSNALFVFCMVKKIKLSLINIQNECFYLLNKAINIFLPLWLIMNLTLLKT